MLNTYPAYGKCLVYKPRRYCDHRVTIIVHPKASTEVRMNRGSQNLWEIQARFFQSSTSLTHCYVTSKTLTNVDLLCSFSVGYVGNIMCVETHRHSHAYITNFLFKSRLLFAQPYHNLNPIQIATIASMNAPLSQLAVLYPPLAS